MARARWAKVARSTGRRHAATAFRPSAPTTASRAPSRRQTVALLAGVVTVAGGVTIASFAARPDTARSFDLFYGSVFIDDNFSPVAIDLSSGKATVRLSDAQTAISATSTENVDMVPLTGGTLMLDPTTGEFNMLDASGFVIKPSDGGVLLPGASDATTVPVPAGDSAYLVRPSLTGTAVYLVGQSTVASAVGVNSGIKPRAAANLSRPSVDDPDVMTGANGELWLLSGPRASTRSLVELSVPAGSNAGVQLDVRRRATVRGTAAVASATVGSDGTGGDAVGVATADSVRVFAPDGTSHTVPVEAPQGLTAILPVGKARGALTYLYRGADEWTLVRVPVSGGRADVSPVTGADASTNLITPVESEGKVFTIAGDQGTLLQIDSDGAAAPIPGFASYPVTKDRERVSLNGASVTADGSRVIFDARANLRAVVVFADGSHPPRVIDKHSAVQVDTKGAAAFTGPKHSDSKPKPPKPGTPKPPRQPRTDQAINNKINCKVVSQTPHIPSVQIGQRGARSVALTWTYPLLDPQDCSPSTYYVTVTTNSDTAPAPPGPRRVQGQDGTTFTGLFPDTDYSVVVTAYINAQHTASPAAQFRTSVEGPPAPSDVRTSVDSAGNWTVSWISCGGLKRDCVPTANWQIEPHICDGVGLSATPDPRGRVGDPTQHAFSFTYQGGQALLGRGLSFDVQGVGARGTLGDIAGDGACSYSWTPVVASNISISASAPPITTSTQSTSQTTVRMNFAGGQTHDLGGVGGEMTYELLRDGDVVGKVGPTTKTTATLPGISAGVIYAVAVVVNPARHRDQSERIGPKDVKPAIAAWPAVSLDTEFRNSSNYNGKLIVTVRMPAGTNNRGETFDLTPNSQLRCENTSMPLSQSNIVPGEALGFDVDRTQYNSKAGSCQVFIGLTQNADTVTKPPLYGDGTTSKGISALVTIDPPDLTAGQTDFSASWNSDSPTANPQVIVRYSGGDPLFLTYARDWDIRVSNNGGQTVCGRSVVGLTVNNPSAIIDIDKGCIRTGGTFTVSIFFRFFAQGPTFTVGVNGSAPQPVDPTRIDFRATYNAPLLALGHASITIDYHGDYHQPVLDALNWSYSITSSLTPGDCLVEPNSYGSPRETGGAPELRLKDSCPGQDNRGNLATYTVTISFHDPNYGVDGSYPLTVLGS